ncbi:MAG: acyl--CoA ligase [Planctomycetaceae bacterium]|nr:acyl--CoA ligase [Planctomycetaceae bacterium]
MKTIWDLFELQAIRSPESIAVCDQGVNYTYRDLREGAIAFAAWLERAQTEPGDRITLLLPNCVQYVTCYLGILKAGRVAVALNTEIGHEELETILDDCRPTVVVLGDKSASFAETLRRLRERIQVPRKVLHVAEPSDLRALVGLQRAIDTDVIDRDTPTALPKKLRELAQIIYTSGTTGRPKGVMLSHKNLVSNCESIVQYLSLKPSDSVLAVLPFFYSYGNSLLITHLAVGGRLVLANEFVFWNRVLDVMEQQRVTGFAGVPSTFAMLLFRSDLSRRRLVHLRYLTCAGGGLLPSHVERLRELLPDPELFLMYGQTEATARLSVLMPRDIDRKAGSIGRGIPGVTLRVLDDAGRSVPPHEVGEIVARGPNLMMGYWNDPEGTRHVLRPEGLRTGDLAYGDEDGYLYIVGRKSDMIKSGSYRISPHEIEDIILRHEDVAEAAVVGQPDEIWGEVPVAFVVPAGDSTVDADALLERCRRTLPRYKLPKRIHVIESLPRTASGKIRRSELRKLGCEAVLPRSAAEPQILDVS